MGRDSSGRKEVTLEDHNIYRIPNFERIGECPRSVKDIMQLVYSSKNLQEDSFLALPSSGDNLSDFDTNAARAYDRELADRAHDLKHICCDPEIMDKAEVEWISVLLPVFLFFDRSKEEKLDNNRPFHHWYVLLCPLWTRLMTPKVLLAVATSRRGPGQLSTIRLQLDLEQCGQMEWDRANSSGKILSSGNAAQSQTMLEVMLMSMGF